MANGKNKRREKLGQVGFAEIGSGIRLNSVISWVKVQS